MADPRFVVETSWFRDDALIYTNTDIRTYLGYAFPENGSFVAMSPFGEVVAKGLESFDHAADVLLYTYQLGKERKAA